MGSITARSIIFKFHRSWGNASGQFGVRKIEFSLNGNRLYLPGYAPGGIQSGGSDNFLNATEITGAFGAASVDTTGFSVEIDEPDHASQGAPVTAWYRWTAPSDGLVHFDTKGIRNTVLAVYTGDTLQSLILVDENYNQDLPSISGFWSYVSFDAVAGQEYKIAVGGFTYNNNTDIIDLHWAMMNAYISVGSASGRVPINAFFLYGQKDGNSSAGNSWSSVSGAFGLNGYTTSGYHQLVLVLGEEITFDEIVINNFHDWGSVTDMGVREAEFYYATTVISQADAEDHTVPVPGEIFILDTDIGQNINDIPMHASSNIVDEYSILIPDPPPEAGVKAGLGLLSLFSNDIDVSTISSGGSIGLKGSFVGASKKHSITCGLAIAAALTGGNESSTAELQAHLSLRFTGSADRDISTHIKSGLCLSCLIKSGRIPACIIKSALAFGVKIGAEQREGSSLSGTIFLGCKTSGVSSVKPPCLAREFQHMDWF